jgi:cytidylate kinase
VKQRLKIFVSIRSNSKLIQQEKAGTIYFMNTSDVANKNAIVITVDGPSGAGKGTTCQMLADKLGFYILDSGALYRLTALAAMQKNVDIADVLAVTKIAAQLDIAFKTSPQGLQTLLEGRDVSRDIRLEQTGMNASTVAAYEPVRAALLARQRAFQQLPGLVADGRDMGTTVFPDATLKIFLTASAEERAQRRYQQLIARGESANLRAQLEDIKARDAADRSRASSPLKAATDAIEIDSTTMPIQDVLDKIIRLYEKRHSSVRRMLS